MQVPETLEIGLVPLLKRGQYPGLFLFSSPARMVRPVINLATNVKEMIGSFEQVLPVMCVFTIPCMYPLSRSIMCTVS